MIKLFDSVDLMAADEKLCVRREGQVFYRDGKPVKKTATSFFVYANVQPMSDRDLMLVPEGDRTKEQYTLFATKCDLPLELNDTVERAGVKFQVQGATNWGSYIKARIMRIDVGPNENAPF